MATIQRRVDIASSATNVWAVLRDFGGLHQMVPGFVASCVREGNVRIVTFSNGVVVHEELVSRDDEVHRLAWTIVGGRFKHHNGSMHVVATGIDTSEVTWTSDLLPDELVPVVDGMMAQVLSVMKTTFDLSTPEG
jgi:hypothetical protein